MKRSTALLLLFWTACGTPERTPWASKTDGDGTGPDDSETDADTDADSDSDTDTDAGDDSGPDLEGDGFDDAGDFEAFTEGSEDLIEVDLTDVSGDSNQAQEFYLITVSADEADIGYTIRYLPTSTDDTAAAGPIAPPRPSRANPAANRPAAPPFRAANPPPSDTFTEADIGFARQEFRVRDDMNSSDSYGLRPATLWGLGTYVAIWVDDGIAIDWDYDCNGIVDLPASEDSFGFDNCDLGTVTDIIDSNIIPNVIALYGEPSDINADGRVSVVITPVLNQITLTSTDEDDFSTVIASYAEPDVDLQEFDQDTNPGSDEQEVIYVFAPDPFGYLNYAAATTLEAYTSYALAAEVALSFTRLVSYNKHVIEAEGAAEDAWLVDVLGALAVDYCGFGAIYHADAWDYLDAPHLYPLAADSTDFGTTDRGAQYLFGRYLYDYLEQQEPGSALEVFNTIMASETTGTESVTDALNVEWNELLVLWQVAMLTTGLTDENGDPLVDPDTFPPYQDATYLDAPPSSPGDFYGANGYQVGINIRGTNERWLGGTSEDPTEDTDSRLVLDGLDVYTYSAGLPYYGFVGGKYTSHVVRLTGVTYDEATVELRASGEGLVGAVVRLPDPSVRDYSVESIFSATDVNLITMPRLPSDGSVVHALGELTEPGAIDVVNAEGDSEPRDAADTDRWHLDLSDRSPTEEVDVVVWLDRHFSSAGGDVAPTDPWVAIVPLALLPVPTEDGTTSGDCEDAAEFAYPRSILDYLYTQVVLSSTMWSDVEEFDACGSSELSGDSGDSAETASCANDWDNDGVLDADEPSPASLLEQIRVMECTLNGGTMPSSLYSDLWMDFDELDEDELVTYDNQLNVGGRSGKDGEEAFVRATLQGGEEYVVVVGGGPGVYEFSVKQIIE